MGFELLNRLIDDDALREKYAIKICEMVLSKSFGKEEAGQWYEKNKDTPVWIEFEKAMRGIIISSIIYKEHKDLFGSLVWSLESDDRKAGFALTRVIEGSPCLTEIKESLVKVNINVLYKRCFGEEA